MYADHCESAIASCGCTVIVPFELSYDTSSLAGLAVTPMIMAPVIMTTVVIAKIILLRVNAIVSLGFESF